MKKVVSLSLVIIMLLSGLFIFTGCVDNDKSDKKDKSSKTEALSSAVGVYQGQYVKLVGDTQKVEEEFSLELNADGTGMHNRDGYSFNVTWSVDGEKFKMSETFVGDPIEYVGTLKDGKLDIFNGDPEDMWTYEYVYEKE